jgi:hypothetical protein
MVLVSEGVASWVRTPGHVVMVAMGMISLIVENLVSLVLYMDGKGVAQDFRDSLLQSAHAIEEQYARGTGEIVAMKAFRLTGYTTLAPYVKLPKPLASIRRNSSVFL